jgi:hypothetical protein
MNPAKQRGYLTPKDEARHKDRNGPDEDADELED